LRSLGGVMIGSNNPQDAEAALEIIKKMKANATASERRQTVAQSVTKIVDGKEVPYTVTKSVTGRNAQSKDRAGDQGGRVRDEAGRRYDRMPSSSIQVSELPVRRAEDKPPVTEDSPSFSPITRDGNALIKGNKLKELADNWG